MLIAGAPGGPASYEKQDVQDLHARPGWARWNVWGRPGSLPRSFTISRNALVSRQPQAPHEGQFRAYEEMVSDEPRLVELLIAQDESMVVQEGQVVTPSWMNKS